MCLVFPALTKSCFGKKQLRGLDSPPTMCFSKVEYSTVVSKPWSLAKAQCLRLHYFNKVVSVHCNLMGGQWLSGRVLDSRPRGRGFEPHRRHCTVVLELDTFILA